MRATIWDEALVERLAPFTEPPRLDGVDPLLAARIGAAYARGVGGRGSFATAGAAGVVLARNHGTLLPLTARSLRRVALIGDPAPLDRLRAALPHASVAHVDDPEAARNADIAVVVHAGDALIDRVNAAQPRTIAVVHSDTPVPLPWLGRVPAVLLADPRDALVDVLFGASEPGGRLPMAWSPELPLGHGHGYTTWEYLALDGTTVRLVNAGTRRGREVVQLYAGGRLAGFAVIEADAGEEVVVQISVAPDAHDLAAGRSAGDLRLR